MNPLASKDTWGGGAVSGEFTEVRGQMGGKKGFLFLITVTSVPRETNGINIVQFNPHSHPRAIFVQMGKLRFRGINV